MKLLGYLVLASLILTLGCQQESTMTEQEVPGINLQYMDTTLRPQEDFYRFANGNWLAVTDIPADQGRWSNFNELRERTNDNVYDIVQKAIKNDNYAADSDQAKAARFFQTAMDSTTLNRLGLQPLQPELQHIEAIDSREALIEYLIQSAPLRNGYLFRFGVYADLNNSNINGAYLSAGNIGLPDRDYYTKRDKESQQIQQQYRDHITRMLQFLDYDSTEARAAARRIYRVEERMADAMYTKEQRRNPTLRNNPRPVEKLAELTPAFDWDIFFSTYGMQELDTIIVSQPKFMQRVQELLSQEDLEALKDYLTWTFMNRFANYTSDEVTAANFDFYVTTLRGVEEMRPRWKRALSNSNRVLGEAIGKLYVDAYFPPKAKAAAEEMVDNILVAFEERIKQLDWMTDSTKMRALEKLSTFTVKIAYPDEWKDYGDLEIVSSKDGGSYVENMINVNRWGWQESLEKLGQEVDKKEWAMSPQTVNAYYNPVNNEIVFPAAILQPPFYNYKADPAVNYGGIGAVIGHEISHGFDDQGSRFDKDGNLKNWWTDRDRKSFEARTKRLVEQYDRYEPLEGVNVNGAFTLGENIGDLGGVNVAYDGLQRHLQQHGDPGIIDGYTQDQRFFISWATIWRTKYRDKTLKTQINTDPHSPGMYRAIGPIINMDAFYAAFDVEPTDAMYRPDSSRVKIW